MKIAISGASGLVGLALKKYLVENAHDVYSLVRRNPAEEHEILWNPESGDIEDMSGIEGIVHLAGENIAAKRWTAEQKALIRQSRVDATRLLCQSVARLQSRPKVFIAASAIGYYGDRADEALTERSSKGSGFLADLCRDWEAATKPAEDAGVRVAHARVSMVLGKGGGALAKLLPIFQIGAGGPIGNGKQYMSWIDEHDLARAFAFLLMNEVSGPVNMCAPNAVTNAEFTRDLAEVLSRPAFMPVPAIALKVIMGELAKELLLSSQKVLPTVLQTQGFAFEYPQLKPALKHVLA